MKGDIKMKFADFMTSMGRHSAGNSRTPERTASEVRLKVNASNIKTI